MSITYTWNVSNLFTIDASPTEISYVVTALYSITGSKTEGNKTYTSDLSLSAYFNVKESDPDFIPYSELTEEIVIGWIQNQLGISQIDSYYASIAGQIEEQINPPVTPVDSPLPWETN